MELLRVCTKWVPANLQLHFWIINIPIRHVEYKLFVPMLQYMWICLHHAINDLALAAVRSRKGPGDWWIGCGGIDDRKVPEIWNNMLNRFITVHENQTHCCWKKMWLYDIVAYIISLLYWILGCWKLLRWCYNKICNIIQTQCFIILILQP